MMNRAILLFGYPGSGKGTQGRILSALPGFHHVSMGDIFRKLGKTNPLYDRVQAFVRAGDLVTDDLVIELLADHIKKLAPRSDDLLILDGVPRNANQVFLLQRHVKVIKIFKLSVYEESLVVNRMKKRGEIEDRADDSSEEVIMHRLQIYKDETQSCLNIYPGTILTRIQANQPIFDVHQDIIGALAKMRDIHFR